MAEETNGSGVQEGKGNSIEFDDYVDAVSELNWHNGGISLPPLGGERLFQGEKAEGKSRRASDWLNVRIRR